jgi:hypothetical protein
MQRRTILVIVAAIAGGVFVLSCGGCLILAALLPDSTTPTPALAAAPTTVVQATAPPTAPPATAIPEPTALPPIAISEPTPLPPIAIPEPTPIPPTATPPAGPPLEVQLYALEIQQHLTSIGEALEELSGLMMAPRLGSDSWTFQVAAQILAIRGGHQAIAAMEGIPDEMAEIHAIILSATSDLDQSMDYLTSGIDNLDVSDLERATALMESGAEKSNQAMDLLNAYLAQFE